MGGENGNGGTHKRGIMGGSVGPEIGIYRDNLLATVLGDNFLPIIVIA